MIKVKFRHEYNEIPAKPKPIKSYWGTTCRIEDDGVELARTTTILSDNDQFSRIFGRSLAYWRAIDSINCENLSPEQKRHLRKQAYLWLEKHNTTILPKEKVGLA